MESCWGSWARSGRGSAAPEGPTKEQHVIPLETEDSARTGWGQTTPAAHLFLWLLLAVTSCLFWDVEAEPSVGWILPPD